MMNETLQMQANEDAKRALAEDMGPAGQDLSALLVSDTPTKAYLFCRDADAVLCGQRWFEACFTQLGAASFRWKKSDGEVLMADEMVCEINSTARTLLSAERSALNFLQTLSATATVARQWQKMAKNTVTVVDTRKTIPLLRQAQKYATQIGGIKNHRLGLYDEILIKENHILSAGSIKNAFISAKYALTPDKIQVEVQTLDQLQEAVAAGVSRVLLDNFSIENIKKAVKMVEGLIIELEASGNINTNNFRDIAQTGIHRVSIGAITKNILATDFSLLFNDNY